MATNPIGPWLERLKRRFSPRRIRIGSQQVSPLPGGDARAVEAVVGRELCLYALIDAGHVPPKQRDGFVALAVRRAAPFDDPDFGVAWLGGHAAVWYWSRARVSELAAAAGYSRIARCLPEAALVGAPRDDTALELWLLSEGLEARAWKDGRLAASRWFAAPPQPGQWLTFLRGAGLTSDATMPAAEPAVSASATWSTRDTLPSINLDALQSWSPRLQRAVTLLAMAALCVQLGAIGRALAQTWLLRNQAAELEAPLRKILDARESADRDQAQIADLLALRAPAAQTALLAEVARLMGRGNWELRQWRQPAPGQVEVTLRLPRPDLKRLVAQWEESPLFTEVSTDAGGRGGEVTIKARIEAGQVPP